MRSASVRFYGSLNDFLPAANRQSTLVCAFNGSPSVKDFVEALGVPHPEIDLIVVHRQSLDFSYRIRDDVRGNGHEQLEDAPAQQQPDGAGNPSRSRAIVGVEHSPLVNSLLQRVEDFLKLACDEGITEVRWMNVEIERPRKTKTPLDQHEPGPPLRRLIKIHVPKL